jgi:Coenzyme PQQ synthesis protein D (PqqD)
MTKDDATLRLREHGLNWREIDGEVVVLDIERSHYLNLNPTGCVLWLMLADGATEAELVQKLTKEFDVDEHTARSDVEAFLNSCRENDLITDAPPTDATG